MYLKIKNTFDSWLILEANKIQYTGYNDGSGNCSGSGTLEFTWGNYPAHINNELIKHNLDRIEVMESTRPYELGKGPEKYGNKYAILDGKYAYVFDCEAYIINDNGKTIAKI